MTMQRKPHTTLELARYSAKLAILDHEAFAKRLKSIPEIKRGIEQFISEISGISKGFNFDKDLLLFQAAYALGRLEMLFGESLIFDNCPLKTSGKK